MCRSVKNIVSVFFLFSISLSQRDFDDELKYKTESIETLKKEIMDLQGKIKKTSSREQSATKKIVTLEKEISLTDRLISELTNEEKMTRELIAKSDKCQIIARVGIGLDNIDQEAAKEKNTQEKRWHWKSQ